MNRFTYWWRAPSREERLLDIIDGLVVALAQATGRSEQVIRLMHGLPTTQEQEAAL